MIKHKGYVLSAPFMPGTDNIGTADQFIQPAKAARGSGGSPPYLRFPNAETGLREGPINNHPTIKQQQTQSPWL